MYTSSPLQHYVQPYKTNPMFLRFDCTQCIFPFLPNLIKAIIRCTCFNMTRTNFVLPDPDGTAVAYTFYKIANAKQTNRTYACN